MFLNNLYFLHFIPDIINFLFLLIVLTYLGIKYNIKKNLFIILVIFLFSPFLFYFLFSWDIFPDQSKYADVVYNFRNFNYNKSLSLFLTSRVDIASLLLAFFPIPFVTTIISVGLINKAILYATILYFLKKKKYFLINLLLFLPSIIFFSSVALREMLVISTAIIFFYFFLEKKNYVISLFFVILFLLIKPHFGILCLGISIAYYIFLIKLNLNVINKTALNSFIVSIIFLLIALLILKDSLINFRNGFFEEEFGYNLIMRNQTITISTILNSLIQFFFSPLSTKAFDLLTVIIFIENLFLIYVAIILIKKIYKENQCKAIFWLVIWVLLFTLFAFVLFNAGTVWRYKFVIQIVIISAMYFSLNNKNRYIYLLKI
jgi:hypothetical protein